MSAHDDLSLASLKDAYKGRRAYILGNGPSLNETDLARLKGELTIGLNRIYMKFPDMGYATTFICCVNSLVLEQFGHEIVAQPSTVFLSADAPPHLEPKTRVFYMRSIYGPGFATDLRDGAWYPGATVTLCALQLA